MQIIRVMQKDIEDGLRCDYAKCPVALAIKRRFPDSRIEVGNYGLWIDSRHYWLNEKLMRFIHNFDRQNSVEPFDFDLESLPCHDH